MVSRRELLGAVGSGFAVAVAGCSICAGRVGIDDVLTLHVDSIHRRADSVQLSVELHYPEEESEEETDFDQSVTHFDDVQVLGYDGAAEEVARTDVGDLDPGDTATASVEADRFPMTLTATPDSVSYDEDCIGVEAGAQLMVYAGAYARQEPFDDLGESGSQPRNQVNSRIARFGTGHRWIPTGTFSVTEDPPPTPEQIRRQRCVHRQLAGRDPTGPPDLSAIPETRQWLGRRETTDVVVYLDLADAPAEHPSASARTVPETVATMLRSTNWTAIDGVQRVRRSVPYEDWRGMVGALRGSDGPSMPNCGSEAICDEHPDGQTKSQCWGGYVRGAYQFELARVLPASRIEQLPNVSGHSIVFMEYEWQGVPRP